MAGVHSTRGSSGSDGVGQITITAATAATIAIAVQAVLADDSQSTTESRAARTARADTRAAKPSQYSGSSWMFVLSKSSGIGITVPGENTAQCGPRAKYVLPHSGFANRMHRRNLRNR